MILSQCQVPIYEVIKLCVYDQWCDKSTVSLCEVGIFWKQSHSGNFVLHNENHKKATWSPKELIPPSSPKWLYILFDIFSNCVNSQHVHIANMLQLLGVRSCIGL